MMKPDETGNTSASGLPSPGAALELLREGNLRYVEGRTDHPPAKGESLARHADGQSPHAVVLTCMDSRVPVERLFDAGAGDVFILRTPANRATGEMLAGVEFGAVVFNIPLIVVLGHTDCKAVRAALDVPERGTAALPEGMGRIARDLSGELLGSGLPCGDLDVAIEANIRLQKRLLGENPALRERQAAGTLAIVGAVYNVGNGRVTFLPD